MKIQDLNGKKICILGYGREGKAMVHALETYVPGCEITITDSNENVQMENGKFMVSQAEPWKMNVGADYLSDVGTFDVIIKSPGIPPNSQLTALGSKLTNSTQIFLDTVMPTATVIGVTGSKGKSTTASLIYHILKASDRRSRAINALPLSKLIRYFFSKKEKAKLEKTILEREARKLPDPPLADTDIGHGPVLLIGNIGDPAIAHIGECLLPNSFMVLEMSSYQLMDMTASPPIAVITSIFPEHLDYHGSFQAYVDAKANIARFQDPGDERKTWYGTLSTRFRGRVYYPEMDKGAASIATQSPGDHRAVSEHDVPLPLSETHLIGSHNLRNIALATRVTQDMGITLPVIKAALRTFQPLPHRLQSLGVIDGIEWVDDAISTTPESTIAALDALGDRVVTIILGGQDRGNDFTELGRRIAASRIKNVILFPGSGPRIREALEKAGAKVHFFDASSMEAAVNLAREHTQPSYEDAKSAIVLLSTASPSYGMFKNFEEKGSLFRSCIESPN